MFLPNKLTILFFIEHSLKKDHSVPISGLVDSERLQLPPPGHTNLQCQILFKIIPVNGYLDSRQTN